MYTISKWPNSNTLFWGEMVEGNHLEAYTWAPQKVAVVFFIYYSPWNHKNDRFHANNPKRPSTNRTQITFVCVPIPQADQNWLLLKGICHQCLQVICEPPKVKVKFIRIYMDFSGMKFHSFDQFFKGLQDHYTRDRQYLDTAPRENFL